jgi:hypothetical protein
MGEWVDRRRIGSALIILLVCTLGACRAAFTVSTVSTSADGLRTFTWPQDALCPAFASARPVSGVLRGEAGAREPVWIEGPDGQRWSVVWPAGFSVTFEPAAELRDEHGKVVARDGDPITLAQTNVDEATGAYDNPYIAHGLSVGAGCYPFVKG